MDVSHDERVRMERAHVLAWPALHTTVIDGWLWRCSGGGSQRANSVSALDFTGTDLEVAIDTAEALYRSRNMPARFHTFDDSAPAGLADALRRRGYTAGETTLTMFRRNDLADPVTTEAAVERREAAWDAWLDVYLGAITESRRAVNRDILRAVPRPRAFFGCRRGEEIVSTALCVAGFGCAVIECVASRPEFRRQGGARSVMQGLLAWAAEQRVGLVGLQVVAGNVAAVRLYESLGFRVGATNRFWQLDEAVGSG